MLIAALAVGTVVIACAQVSPVQAYVFKRRMLDGAKYSYQVVVNTKTTMHLPTRAAAGSRSAGLKTIVDRGYETEDELRALPPISDYRVDLQVIHEEGRQAKLVQKAVGTGINPLGNSPYGPNGQTFYYPELTPNLPVVPMIPDPKGTPVSADAGSFGWYSLYLFVGFEDIDGQRVAHLRMVNAGGPTNKAMSNGRRVTGDLYVRVSDGWLQSEKLLWHSFTDHGRQVTDQLTTITSEP